MGFKHTSRRRVLQTIGTGAIIGTAGCSALGDDEIEMRYAHVNAPDSFVGQNASNLADEIEERTDGSVTMDVFPGAELGDSAEIIEGIQTGSIDMAHNTWAGLAAVKEDLAVFDHPYIYDDRDHALRAADPEQSELLQQFNEDIEENQDMRVAGSVYYGFRHATLNEAATSPEEFEGKQVRAIPWEVYLATVRGLGASPESVEFSELASGLATGLVDGQENPLTTIYTSNFQDHQSHLILSGHILSVMPLFMSLETWEQMSESEQDAVTAALNDVGEDTREATVKREEELVDVLADEGGMTVVEESEVDIDAFTESCHTEVEEEFPEWDEYKDIIANT
jgi:tripartite ATP-independent transporter DctP family solute receptor